MLDIWYLYIIMVGMGLATYATREVPYLILGNKPLNSKIVLWLSFVPVSVLSALLIPELLMVKEGGQHHFYISIDNLYILTGFCTFLVAYFSKNFFVTIVFGMVFLATYRYFIGL